MERNAPARARSLWPPSRFSACAGHRQRSADPPWRTGGAPSLAEEIETNVPTKNKGGAAAERQASVGGNIILRSSASSSRSSTSSIRSSASTSTRKNTISSSRRGMGEVRAPRASSRAFWTSGSLLTSRNTLLLLYCFITVVDCAHHLTKHTQRGFYCCSINCAVNCYQYPRKTHKAGPLMLL